MENLNQDHEDFIKYRNDIFHDKLVVTHNQTGEQFELKQFTPGMMKDMIKKIQEFDFNSQLQYYNHQLQSLSYHAQQKEMASLSLISPLQTSQITHSTSPSYIAERVIKEEEETHVKQLQRKRQRSPSPPHSPSQ